MLCIDLFSSKVYSHINKKLSSTSPSLFSFPRLPDFSSLQSDILMRCIMKAKLARENKQLTTEIARLKKDKSEKPARWVYFSKYQL